MSRFDDIACPGGVARRDVYRTNGQDLTLDIQERGVRSHSISVVQDQGHSSQSVHSKPAHHSIMRASCT
jgi:hypothetical protein